MKIALFGYGKMGRIVEQVALSRGHEIVLKASSSLANGNIEHADVAIDFSTPEVAPGIISSCLKKKVPIVSGTTGWLNDFNAIVELCHECDGAFIYASNFSLGVNIFFELNKHLAKMMHGQSQYTVDIEETHHTEKMDAPSGTAISLANDIIDRSDYEAWNMEKPLPSSISITSKRIEQVPGTHLVRYRSEVDTISIMHGAHNRKGFALGAVIAAEWLLGKSGVFTMKDVLNIG